MEQKRQIFSWISWQLFSFNENEWGLESPIFQRHHKTIIKVICVALYSKSSAVIRWLCVRNRLKVKWLFTEYLDIHSTSHWHVQEKVWFMNELVLWNLLSYNLLTPLMFRFNGGVTAPMVLSLYMTQVIGIHSNLPPIKLVTFSYEIRLGLQFLFLLPPLNCHFQKQTFTTVIT